MLEKIPVGFRLNPAGDVREDYGHLPCIRGADGKGEEIEVVFLVGEVTGHVDRLATLTDPA